MQESGRTSVLSHILLPWKNDQLEVKIKKGWMLYSLLSQTVPLSPSGWHPIPLGLEKLQKL
jgi:hypothetical protein